MSTKHWTELKSHPYRFIAEIFQISPTEFVTIPQKGGSAEADGIYKYNIARNDWTKIINYDDKFETTCHSTGFDKRNNIIYLCNAEKNIYEINLNENKINSLATNGPFWDYPSVCFVDNVLHIVEENSHHIFDLKESKFEKLCDLPFFLNEGCVGQNFVYLKSTQSLILINGDIYEYSLINKEWQRWNIFKNEMCKEQDLEKRVGATVVVTNDEAYIIMVGGMDENLAAKNDISIIDVAAKTIQEIDLKCPDEFMFNSILCCDQLQCESLVYGWIRNIYYDQQLLPVDIMKIIEQYVYQYDLHIIASSFSGMGQHWKIDVQQILDECDKQN